MVSTAGFTLSAFGDEIADDLEVQLQVLRDLRIGYLELRGAWGKSVLCLDDEDVAAVRSLCAQYGIRVSCIASPVGKSPITEGLDRELANLTRILQIADALGTRSIRVFSFYPPHSNGHANYDDYLEEATARLARLTELARRQNCYLLLENEKAIVGDTLIRCHALLTAVGSSHLRFLWDPANFVQVGEKEPTSRGWASLGPYVAHVHVKDALLSDGSVRPAGDGDGQVGELLARLRESRYQGFLALEPHLSQVGPSGGFSGPSGMRHAARALRALMAAYHCGESPTAL
jgi:sugar phosphate isomerase/epimerase